MKIKNFELKELKEFFDKGKIYFISFNKFYTLKLSKKWGFYFQENPHYRNKDKLPYTIKGRFFAYNYENVKKLNFIFGIDKLTS